MTKYVPAFLGLYLSCLLVGFAGGSDTEFIEDSTRITLSSNAESERAINEEYILNLDHMGLGIDNMLRASMHIRRHGHGFKVLNLSHNNIAHPAELWTLVETLNYLPTVTSLDLSYNKLTEEGIEELFKAKHIKKLNLSYNHIGFRGLIKCMVAVSTPHLQKAVSLKGNPLSIPENQLVYGELLKRHSTNLVEYEEPTITRLWLAARQGDAVAQYNLAAAYHQGQEVERDFIEAAKWYLKSAAQGHPDAQFNVGMLCKKGEIVIQDYTEAMKWFQRAAEQGHPEAKYYLGWGYEHGCGVPESYVEAMKWYREAAEQSYSEAQYHLGDMYQAGCGLVKDEAEAMKWFQRAAEQGHSEAQTKLSQYSTLDSHETVIEESEYKKPKPTFVFPLESFSEIPASSRDYVQELKTLEQGLAESNPNAHIAAVNLLRLYTDAGEHLKKSFTARQLRNLHTKAGRFIDFSSEGKMAVIKEMSSEYYHQALKHVL